MATVQDFEVIPDKCNTVLICTTENNVQKWINKLCN